MNATTAKAPIPHKYKAGVILVGDVAMPDGTTRLHVLAPWTEGSFTTDGKKAYMVAKGTIDKNEELWPAAIREMGEETGIYLDATATDERAEKDRRYVFNPESETHRAWKAEGRDCFYPDVEIEKIWQQPVMDAMVPSNRGNPTPHTLYLVKVKGIEHLAPHLKHRENNVEGDGVGRKAEHVAVSKIAAKKLPAFVELLDTLRTGRWKWGDDPAQHGVLFDDAVGIFEKDYLRRKHGRMTTTPEGWEYFQIDPRIAADIESGRLTIAGAQEFDDFYQNYAIERNVQDTIKERVDKIRKYMTEIGLTNDRTSLKVDTKNAPLRYYQEGADIIPYDTWLDRAIAMAEVPENRVYREAQFNRLITDRKPGRAYEGLGQSIGGMILEVGRKLEMHEANLPLRSPGARSGACGAVVFDGAQSIFNELGHVVYASLAQEPAVRALHEQVCSDRKARGAA